MEFEQNQSSSRSVDSWMIGEVQSGQSRELEKVPSSVGSMHLDKTLLSKCFFIHQFILKAILWL